MRTYYLCLCGKTAAVDSVVSSTAVQKSAAQKWIGSPDSCFRLILIFLRSVWLCWGNNGLCGISASLLTASVVVFPLRLVDFIWTQITLKLLGGIFSALDCKNSSFLCLVKFQTFQGADERWELFFTSHSLLVFFSLLLWLTKWRWKEKPVEDKSDTHCYNTPKVYFWAFYSNTYPKCYFIFKCEIILSYRIKTLNNVFILNAVLRYSLFSNICCWAMTNFGYYPFPGLQGRWQSLTNIEVKFFMHVVWGVQTFKWPQLQIF